MTQDNEQCRAGFEAWAREKEYDIARYSPNSIWPVGDYKSTATAHAWNVWREAKREASTEPSAIRDAVLEEAAALCEGMEGDMFDQYKGRGKHAPNNEYRADPYMNGQSDGAGQCAEAIRKLKAGAGALTDDVIPEQDQARTPLFWYDRDSTVAKQRVFALTVANEKFGKYSTPLFAAHPAEGNTQANGSTDDAKDAARLDFMIAEECQVEHLDLPGKAPLHRVRWPYLEQHQREWSRSGREAIDAAIEARTKAGSGNKNEKGEG